MNMCFFFFFQITIIQIFCVSHCTCLCVGFKTSRKKNSSHSHKAPNSSGGGADRWMRDWGDQSKKKKKHQKKKSKVTLWGWKSWRVEAFVSPECVSLRLAHPLWKHVVASWTNSATHVRSRERLKKGRSRGDAASRHRRRISCSLCFAQKHVRGTVFTH